MLDYKQRNSQEYFVSITNAILHCNEFYWIREIDVTYVDAILNKEKNTIDVVERIKGQRIYTSWPSRYVVYFPSERGRYTSIFGQRMDKFETTRSEEFQRELRIIPQDKRYESDINPIFRCIYDHYKNAPSPKLNILYFDIETDFSQDHGFSTPEDAFNPVTAISFYASWLNKNFTLVIKPKTLTVDQSQDIVNKFEDTVLCENEEELLDVFLSMIEDADILTGWNSTNYDIPYLHNRIVQVLGKEHTRRFCLWNKFPKRREYKSYGKDSVTYDLLGRVHLDYLELYRKHTYHEMHSYRLDFVGEYEVKEKKIAYDGTLDALYNNDFEKFIAYSRQDVMLLVKIDNKLKFIELSMDLAHSNGVLLATTLGSVAMIDNAITNEAHEQGFVIPDRKKSDSDRYSQLTEDDDDAEELTGIAGAFVADPKKGLHNWIGCVDINSLYPSTIRALNMSRETVVGQIRPIFTDKRISDKMHDKESFAESWAGMFGTIEYNMVMNKESNSLTIDFEDGQSIELEAKDIYEWIFTQDYILSANGTIFNLKTEGIVPKLLSDWYSGRKQYQKIAKQFEHLANDGIDLSDMISDQLLGEINEILKNKDTVSFTIGGIPNLTEILSTQSAEKISDFIIENKLALIGHKLVAATKEVAVFFEEQHVYYDRLQLIRKILLNSLYGAIGNIGSKFFDARIAQSTTLTGRCIVRHMGSKINELVTGEYTLGEACIYGDTDSIFFSVYEFMRNLPDFKEFEWSKENITNLYDNIADLTNATFPAFMRAAFNVPEQRNTIKAGREYIASNGLFITKKRYAVMMYDKEGTRLDVDGKPGKIKAMGLDLKRADSPLEVRDFLSKVLFSVLTGVDKNDIFNTIKDFRKEFYNWPSWAKGSPKRVNNLTMYAAVKKNMETADMYGKHSNKKKTIPGHVLASLNYLKLRNMFNDNNSMPIIDGSKVVVCKLKSNPYGMTSVAYPIDQLIIPDWFKSLPFDDAAMEEAVINKKLENLLGVLDWNLDETKNNETFDELFTF